MIRFFDHHLRGGPRPEWAPVRYYTMGAERWQSAQTWPPPGLGTRDFFVGTGGRLEDTAPAEGIERVELPSGTTGRASRWRSYVGPHQFIGYPKRAQQTQSLPVFRSDPLERDVEVTGHPSVRLDLHAGAGDGDLFVYLEEEEAGGAVRYITEGMLRLSHRALQDAGPYASPAPYRSFHREHARPLVADEPNAVRIDLLPVSYRVRRGSRLRLVLAGGDVENFGEPLALGPVGVALGSASVLTVPVAP